MLSRIGQELGIMRAISQPWIMISAAERCRTLLHKIAVFRGVQLAMEDHVISRDLRYLLTPCLEGFSQGREGNGLFQDTVLWMAVPKKRTSHSKKRMRMTHKWLKPVRHYTFCRNCGSPKLLHILCGQCFKETMRKTAEYRRMKEQHRAERKAAKKSHRVPQETTLAGNADTV